MSDLPLLAVPAAGLDGRAGTGDGDDALLAHLEGMLRILKRRQGRA
jgi:hypothetical protein